MSATPSAPPHMRTESCIIIRRRPNPFASAPQNRGCPLRPSFLRRRAQFASPRRTPFQTRAVGRSSNGGSAKVLWPSSRRCAAVNDSWLAYLAGRRKGVSESTVQFPRRFSQGVFGAWPVAAGVCACVRLTGTEMTAPAAAIAAIVTEPRAGSRGSGPGPSAQHGAILLG
jgi:hypothetical protein